MKQLLIPLQTKSEPELEKTDVQLAQMKVPRAHLLKSWMKLIYVERIFNIPSLNWLSARARTRYSKQEQPRTSNKQKLYNTRRLNLRKWRYLH